MAFIYLYMKFLTHASSVHREVCGSANLFSINVKQVEFLLAVGEKVI